MDVAPVADAETQERRVPRAWVVRADSGKYTDDFITGGYVGTALVDVVSADNREEIRRRYEQAHPEKTAQAVGVQVGQIVAFLFEMCEGDYVITPEADTEWLRYGRVIGKSVSAAGDDGCPFRNRRDVDWSAKPLRRHDFSESLQNTLGSLLAVFEVDQTDEIQAAIGKVEQEDGVAVEREDPELGTIERPFDPSKIKVRTVPVLVEQLISRIKYGEIDLARTFSE